MTKRAKKRIALLLGVLVVGTGGLVIARQVRQSQRIRLVAEKKESGVAARAAGDHRRAVQDLGYYLASASNAGVKVDPTLWLDWADSRRLSPEENYRHIFEAINGAKQAAELMPNDPRPQEMLLDLYARVAKVAERLNSAEKLLAINPKHHDAMFAKALALRQLGRSGEAMKAGKSMVDAFPEDVSFQVGMLELMMDENRSAKELEDYAAGVAARFPDNLRLRLLQASVFANNGNLDEAKKTALAAAKMKTSDPVALKELLDVLDRLDLTQESAEVAKAQFDAAPPGSEILVVAAERCWKLGQLKDAQGMIRKAIVPPAQATDRLLGWWALVEGDEPAPGGAEHPARAELRKRPTAQAAAWGAVLDALRDMSKGDWSKSREELAIALANNPQDSMANFLMGQVERNLGDPDAAIKRWQAMALRESKWVKLNIDLASLLMQQGRAKEGYAYAVRALFAAPDQGAVVPVVARAAVAMIETGQAEKTQSEVAIKFLEECHAQVGDSGELLAMLARAYAGVGREADARQAVQTILDKKLNVSAESIRLLASLSRTHNWGLDESLAASSKSRGEDDPTVAFAVAMESAAAGRSAEGKALLEQGVTKHSGAEKAEFELRLAAYLDVIGDPGAKEMFVKLAEQNARNAQFQISLLQSRCVWSDQTAVTQAIGRLRSLAGDSSSTWRIFEARRLLTFEPNEKNASTAAQLLDELIRVDPRAIPPRELAAEAWIILGDRARAELCLTQALDTDPQQVRIYPRLIGLLQQDGDTEKAERYLRQFAERANIPDDIRRHRAYLAQSQGMWDVAIADLEHLAKLGNPSDKLGLARLHQFRGDTSEAESLFKELTDRSDADPASLVAAADFYAATGRFELGRQTLVRVPDEPQGRRTALLAGYVDRHGDAAEAEQLYTSLTATSDKIRAAQAWNDLARFDLRRRAVDKANDAVRKGLAAKPDDADLGVTAGIISLVKAEQIDAGVAAELLQRLQSEEQGGAARATLDALNARAKNPDDAAAFISALERICAKNPSFFPATQVLVETYARSGAMDKAVDTARASMRTLPTDPRPARLAAVLLAQAGRLEEGVASAKQWRDLTLNDPIDAEALLADICIEMGRYADALKWIEGRKERIVAESDKAPERLELLASALAGAGRESESHDLLWTRATRDPAWARRYLHVKDAMKSRPAQAHAWVAAIAPSLRESADGRLALGQAWYDLGLVLNSPDDFRQAIEDLKPALDDPKTVAYASAISASSFEQLGDAQSAEAMYRLSIKSQPDNAATLNNLAYLLSARPEKCQEALDLANKAVSLSPRTIMFLDTQATVLLKLGRLADAERVFKQAIQIDGGDATLLLGLAETHVRQGKLDDARSLLDRVDLLVKSTKPLDPKSADRLKAIRLSAQPQRTSAEK